MLYSLSNTLVNINRISTPIVPPDNNGYQSPSPDNFFYVAPNQRYYIQPAP